MVNLDGKNQLRALSFTKVTIDDGFWSPRLRTNREQTIPSMYEQCQQTGRIDAFALRWRPGDEPVPHYFWDSDVAKWIEAASYSLASEPDGRLEALLDEVIALIASAQQSDGYLNTYFTAVAPERRWSDLRDAHELYCAGHMIEAAVAHFQATGKRSLLDVLCRYADHIAATFGTGEGQRRGYCGHEEIELALIKLYHVTGNERYLALSSFFVDERGQSPNYFEVERRERGTPGFSEGFRGQQRNEYDQSHKPVREQDRVVGHAVRAMYLYSAMADLARERQDETLKRACERLWVHLCEQNLYLTGGVGSSRNNEGFTNDYDLPNETAYAESCAAIGLVFWAQRMLHLDCDGRYADVMERALYNGILSGVSLDGTRYFYDNPLESRGNISRHEWFDCACCPPNIARLLASFGGYIYSQGEQEAVVHLYVQSETTFELVGQQVHLRQETEYPWDGTVTFKVDVEQQTMFRLKLRRPGWCREVALEVNGESYQANGEEYGYLVIEREWRAGDIVTLVLNMPVERVYAHPLVRADRQRVALQRGPLVYCLEGVDNGEDLDALFLGSNSRFEPTFAPEILGGIVVLDGHAQRLVIEEEEQKLYNTTPPTSIDARIRAIPYCLWANREQGEMLVWLRSPAS